MRALAVNKKMSKCVDANVAVATAPRLAMHWPGDCGIEGRAT
jgi:hypothetical protein